MSLGSWIVAHPSARRCFQPTDRLPVSSSSRPSRSAILQDVGAPLGELLVGQAVDAGVEAQVLVDGQVLEERELLRHVADVRAHLLGLGVDVVAHDLGAAAGRRRSCRTACGSSWSCPTRSGPRKPKISPRLHRAGRSPSTATKSPNVLRRPVTSMATPTSSRTLFVVLALCPRELHRALTLC